MDKLIVSVGGVFLIGFIYWFFFGKKGKEAHAAESGDAAILVDGGYNPSVIKVPKGKETSLKILRKDANTCLEEFVLPAFKKSSYLPLNKEVVIKIKPKETGEFGFHCGMNMYHGKIVVE